MQTSEYWIEHFSSNVKIERVNWSLMPSLTDNEKHNILLSVQAWQLGETSDGSHLLKASRKYAHKNGDHHYPRAVELFIKEEQKHGNNLGRYLDMIGKKRIKKNWADTLFRRIRYFNSSMELWTLAVITVESTAQVFYQALKEATGCVLLKQICTDILIDEAHHIDFQIERFAMIYDQKSRMRKYCCYYLYKTFFFATITVVWFAYRRCLMAGNNDFSKYWVKMCLKFKKTIGSLKPAGRHTKLADAS
ncbi:MAG: ferritin-like domain-containing protein [Ginsengibacter sp.]